MSKILIELKSYRDDGKFVENESDEELSLEEAIQCVIDYWGDMGSTYYSWDCKKVILKEDGGINDRKRFYNNGKYVMKDGVAYVACDGEHNAAVVATVLNESLKENESLKQEVENLQEQLKEKRLVDEND